MIVSKFNFAFSLIVVFLINSLTIAAESNNTDAQIVTRSEWGALPPRRPPAELYPLPPTYVIISHTASGACLTMDKCIKYVRNVQMYHVQQRGFDDIAYNFLIGGDGLIYEGRGWDVRGAHTFNYNDKSIGISFIGTFDSNKPTEDQINAAEKLLAFGLKEKKLSNDYKLLGHRQVASTRSPGDKLYEIIKTWEHWIPNP